MAGFRINLFKGIRPRISAKKLPAGEAQTAQNVKLGSGDIAVWDEKDAGTAVSKQWYTKSIYRYDNAGSPIWFEWDQYVDVARGPVKDDSLERTYYTGDGVPKMTYTTIADEGGGGPYPETSRDLGIPAPPNPLAVAGVGLPENVAPGDRTFSSATCDAFVWKKHVYPPNTAPAASPAGAWDYDPSVRINEPYLSQLERQEQRWIIPAGTGFRVSEVIDSTTAVLESSTHPGLFARASEMWTVYDHTSQYPESNAAGTSGYTETGNAQEGHTSEGWDLPPITVTFDNAHNLTQGDVIQLSGQNEEDTVIKHILVDGTIYYEQSWPAAVHYPQGGATDFWIVEGELRVSAAAIEGNAQFSLTGFFQYFVDRGASEATQLDDRQYVYTYVSNLGEEGPPSPVSAPAYSLEGKTVTLRGFENVFTHSDLLNRNITHFNIYRTNSSSAGTEFQFVRQIPVGTSANPVTEFADNVESGLLGEVIESTTWFPPDEDMEGIITLPNGMLAGFKGKNVYMCEPFFPHAWPPEYDQAVDYDVVGLANFGNTLVVLTKGYPYLASGSHPRSMNLRPVKVNMPCSNKESIASSTDRVYYASPDGLVEISANGVRVVTAPYAQKDEWQSYSPTTMVGSFHDGRYFGFFDGPSNVTQAPTTATLSGTAVTSIDEDDVQAGGKTIIITLAGTHTWEDAGASFDATRQGIIDSFVATSDETNGWNDIRPSIPVTDVARTSATVVTITLSAQSAYEISTSEVVECSLPPTVFKATVPTDNIQASNSITIVTADDFVSRALYFGAGSSNTGATMLLGYSTGDADAWTETSAVDYRGSDTLLPTGLHQFLSIAVYDNLRQTWSVLARGPQPTTRPIIYTSVDGTSWAARDVLENIALSAVPPFTAYYPEYDLMLMSYAAHSSQWPAAYSNDGGVTWRGANVGTANDYDSAEGESGFAFLNGEFFIGAWKDNTVAPKLIVGNAGAPGERWESIAVTLATGSPTGSLDSVCAGNGKVLYAWCNATSKAEIGYYNPVDGTTTSIGAQPSGTWVEAKLCFGNGKFMIVSSSGVVSTVDANDSETTIGNWSTPITPMPANTVVHNLYYDPGDGVTAGWGWVVCGQNSGTNKGVILTSNDNGATWTTQYTTTGTAQIHSMAFDNYIRDEERR